VSFSADLTEYDLLLELLVDEKFSSLLLFIFGFSSTLEIFEKGKLIF